MIHYSTLLQFTTNYVLTSGTVLLPKLFTRIASVLGKYLTLELDTTEDVHQIEAFFEGIQVHTALAIDNSFGPVVKYLVEHQMLLSDSNVHSMAPTISRF